MDWSTPQNKLVKELTKKRFAWHTIRSLTGLTRGQIEYRRHALGLTLSRQYKAGATPEARAIIERYDDLIRQCRELRAQGRAAERRLR